MARSSDKDIILLIVFFLSIFVFPFVVIFWIIKGIVKFNTLQQQNPKKEKMVVYNPKYSHLNRYYLNDRVLIYKTKEDIKNDANGKYERISETQKKKYLIERKTFLKAFYSIFSSFIFLLADVFLLLGLKIQQTQLFFFVLSGLMFLTGIFLMVVMFIKLNSCEKTLILEQLRKQLRKTYKELTSQKVYEYKSYVQQNSPMFKSVKRLNDGYSFDKEICKKHNYSKNLNNKRQFDCFDYTKWVYQLICSNPHFFDRLDTIYDEECKKYDKYSSEYNLLKKFRDESDVEDLSLDFETFNYIERKIYNENKKPPIIKPSITLQISYTSPTGRNHYYDEHTYTYYDLLKIIEEKEQSEQLVIKEKERKEKLAQEKREKEKKLRDLNKLEAKLSQKEKEITAKEKEFIEATREHIYTADKIELTKQKIEIDENLSLTQKLKLLRTKFDNGEITYEEYQSKRKELM